MDGRGLKKVVSASILDLGEVIESDHAAIRIPAHFYMAVNVDIFIVFS